MTLWWQRRVFIHFTVLVACTVGENLQSQPAYFGQISLPGHLSVGSEDLLSELTMGEGAAEQQY